MDIINKCQLLKKANATFFFIVFALLLSLLTTKATARIVDDVEITPQPDGYIINLDFEFPMRYVNHTPDEPSEEFRVQLRPVNTQSLTYQQEESLSTRSTLSWDYTTGIPLEEIVFEGGDPQFPHLTLLFSKEVEVQISSSLDLRSLVVTVKTKPAITTLPGDQIDMGEEVIPEDEKLAELMKQARQSMTEWKYPRAIQLYTKIITLADGNVKKQAREFLGLARERNGQLAHAKAQYQSYLEDYPEGPDADRVRQRLAGLITAAKTPKVPLKEIRPQTKLEEKLSKWDTYFYGSLSSFYFYDQTTPEGGETRVNRSDMTSDFDFNARWRNEDYDMRLQSTGGYSKSFLLYYTNVMAKLFLYLHLDVEVYFSQSSVRIFKFGEII